MTVGGAVAAQRSTALLAGAQMDPLRPDLHALGALPALGVLHGCDRTEMSAGTVGHCRPLLLVQHLVYGRDCDRSLAHGRCDEIGRASCRERGGVSGGYGEFG